MIRHSCRLLTAWATVCISLLLTASILAAADSSAAGTAAKDKIQIEKWLILGPIEAPFPAFNDEDDASKMDAGQLLEYGHLNMRSLRPKAGDMINLAEGATMPWRPAAAGTSGVLIEAETGMPQVAYLAAYLEVPRWTKIEISARGSFPFEVFVNHESVLKRKDSGKLDDVKSGQAKLESGKHLLLVKTVLAPGDSLPGWQLDIRVGAGDKFQVDPAVSLDPTRSMTIGEVLNGPTVGGVEVSSDGRHFLLSMSRRTMPEGESERWVEIRRTDDGRLVKTLQDLAGAGSWQWAPSGNRLSYVARKDEAGTLRILDLDTGGIETIVENVKDFSGYSWSPDGTYIVYSVVKKPEEDKTGVKRLRGPYDRRHDERDKSSLYLASVPAGINRRLTAGKHSTRLYSIHPDGRQILIGRSYEDLSERPYDQTEMILLDRETQATELLFTGRWLYSARWSPDGRKILLTAGPSTFGETGMDVPAGVIPNDYDTQAYIFDPKTKQVDPITKHFDPAVESVYWPPGRDLYIVAEETEYTTLYRYDSGRGSYTKIELPCEVLSRRGAARNKPVMVFSGCKANEPWRVYAADMKDGKVKMLLEPARAEFENIRIGRVEDWNFTASSGKEIVGRIYYPPGFNAALQWPCIVYYYGGTSPVNRAFLGRYPKNLWAANNYVVYVLQPSGATGFGQEFSAKHVNDWGKTTAGEIIEGTRKFLEAHSFVDPKRVGCIGASYGGFMTQLLITKTDIFGAAVSHAGISSIMSYWGEGYWGYLYNAVSAAESFPWNRPDIYVDQSPLNAADKITTPLLLLHGTADTNVPPGESEQMYTALKLLGKEVEYLRIDGQNHFILDYKKRVAWSNAILAWFDKWLKEQPEWWDDTYPPLDAKGQADGK